MYACLYFGSDCPRRCRADRGKQLKTQAYEHFLKAGGAQDVRRAVVEVNGNGLPERKVGKREIVRNWWVRSRVDRG